MYKPPGCISVLEAVDQLASRLAMATETREGSNSNAPARSPPKAPAWVELQQELGEGALRAVGVGLEDGNISDVPAEYWRIPKSLKSLASGRMILRHSAGSISRTQPTSIFLHEKEFLDFLGKKQARAEKPMISAADLENYRIDYIAEQDKAGIVPMNDQIRQDLAKHFPNNQPLPESRWRAFRKKFPEDWSRPGPKRPNRSVDSE